MKAADPVQLGDEGNAPTLPSPASGGGKCISWLSARGGGKCVACDPDRDALLEVQLEQGGVGGGVVHRRGPSECVLGGYEESIFQHPGLDGSPPKVLIHTVRRLGFDINRQVFCAGVCDFRLAG